MTLYDRLWQRRDRPHKLPTAGESGHYPIPEYRRSDPARPSGLPGAER